MEQTPRRSTTPFSTRRDRAVRHGSRPLTAVLTIAVLGGLISATPPAATAAPKNDPDRRVIVTLDGDAPVAGLGTLDDTEKAGVLDARGKVKAEQDAFLSELTDKGVDARKPRKLNLLLNAVAVTVKASEVGRLKNLPGVTGVHDDTQVKLHTSDSVPLIGAPEVWQREDPSGQKATGKGVTVAVLDSGVDYTHPDLGGGIGEGKKVAAGWDYVNGDADPMDDNGHGTHVAGIIAGKAAEEGGVTGVAPEATLTAYKVMNDAGEGATSDIIAAIEAASDPANPHRADVINMSLGGYGDGSEPLGQAATAATKAGVVVVAAAGNEGPSSGTVGTPAAADGVLAVGASVSGVRIPTAAYKGGEKIQTYRGLLSANPPAQPVTAPLVDVGQGLPEDWERVGDVRGKVVLIARPIGHSTQDLSIEEIEAAREAERRGALALIGGQSGGGPVVAQAPAEEDGTLPFAPNTSLDESGDSLRMDKVLMMGVDGTQYAELGRRLAAGPVEITVTGKDVTDKIASFSSRGPDASWDLKPEIVAPGYEIRSTVPKSLYGPGVYRMSGTSMAAPHIAGAAALIRQLHPGEAPAKVTSELIGSTKKLDDYDPTTAGSGRLDLPAAADAADAGLTTSPAALSYGLADLAGRTIGGSKKLTVHNSSGKPRTVSLKVSGEATVSPRTLTVPAGGSATATVTVRAERPAQEREFSGTVTVDPSPSSRLRSSRGGPTGAGPTLRVPYLLVVRQLFVQVGPDPSDGKATAVVFTPAPLAQPPVLTVYPPRGRPYSVTTKLRSGNVYQADLTGTEGAYLVTAGARTTGGQTLTSNRDGFEVTPESVRDQRWQPVGPNAESGEVSTAASAPGHAVVSQPNKKGLWSTEDNGKTWRQNTRVPFSAVGGEAFTVVDPRDEKRWWYAANDPSRIPRTGSILRTEDAGRTWQTLDTPDTPVLNFLASDDGRTLIALTGAGLLLSTDGGDHWTQQPVGIQTDLIQDVAVAGDTLYLSTGTALWKRDGVASGTLGDAVKLYESKGGQFATETVADSEVIAFYEIGTGVVGSHDGGKTFSVLDNHGYGGTGLTITGGDVYASYGGETRVGRDHGRTWETIPGVNNASVASDFDRWADGSLTVSAEAAGIYRGTADGQDYQRLGVQGGTVSDLAVSDGKLLAAGWQGTHRASLPVSAADWGTTGGEGMIGLETKLIQASPADSRVVWRVRYGPWGDFHLERSGDSGESWEEKGASNGQVFALTVHPADPERVHVSFGNLQGSGLFSTEDGGTTWKNLWHDTHFTAVAGDPADSDRLWLGTPHGLYRSDNGGDDIELVTEGRVDSIEFAGRKMLIGGDAIRYSTDGGTTFRSGDTGQLPIRIGDFERIGDTLYAASTSYWETALPRGGRGVLRSTDGGRTWHNISSGLQNLDVTSLATDGEDLYAGTEYGGVHRLDLD